MKKFLVIYHAPESARGAAMSGTPEQQAAGMKAWMDWAQKTGSQLVDMGSPLDAGAVISPNGSSHASKAGASGFSIVQAENMEQAKALFKGHPHINGWSPEATIEIHETMAIPGM